MCSKDFATSVALILVLLPSFDLRPNRGFYEIFLDLNCEGRFNASAFARLDRVCEDCYNLFREQEIHKECK